MQVKIIPATMRDVTWIAGNLRERDHAEIYCQVKDESPAMVGYQSLQSSRPHAYVATIDENPVTAFGLSVIPSQPWLGYLWAYGTAQAVRTIPAITRHIKTVCLPDVLSGGTIKRFECRSLAAYTQAHNWLVMLGLEPVATLEAYGKNGEDFVLFAQTAKALENEHVFDAENGQRALTG